MRSGLGTKLADGAIDVGCAWAMVFATNVVVSMSQAPKEDFIFAIVLVFLAGINRRLDTFTQTDV